MNSQEQVFRMLGISSENVVGAELKETAQQFMQVCQLLPNKLHTRAEDMLKSVDEHDATSTNTQPSGLASSQATRADLFTAGFPCQPWSHMTRKRHSPDTHPLFAQFEIVVSYIRRTSPRLALLENVLGFVHAESFGEHTAFEHLQTQLSPTYVVGFVEVNLMTWVRLRRPRIFIFCIHRDVGDEAMLRRAQELAYAFEAKRQTEPPKRVEDYCFPPGSSDWTRAVLGDLGGREGAAPSRPAPILRAGRKEAWRSETAAIREFLEKEGKPWAKAHPLQNAHLRGISRTERQVEILECVLMLRCHARNMSPDDLASRQGLKWDVSQNVSLRNKKSLSTEDLGCTCTGAVVYSFELDRILHPAELLRAMGWVNFSLQGVRLSMGELADLVGEAQALPSLAVTTWALLIAAGARCEGLWK